MERMIGMEEQIQNEEGTLILDPTVVTDGHEKGVSLTDFYGLPIFNEEVVEKVKQNFEHNSQELTYIEAEVFRNTKNKSKEEIGLISKKVFTSEVKLTKEQPKHMEKEAGPPYVLITELMVVFIFLVGYFYFKKKKKERELHLDYLDDRDSANEN